MKKIKSSFKNVSDSAAEFSKTGLSAEEVDDKFRENVLKILREELRRGGLIRELIEYW